MKSNKTINQITAGILIPSILLPSCLKPNHFDDESVIQINQKNIEKRSDINNSIAVPLRFNLEDQKLLDFISQITRDIVNNPLIARQFAENKQSFSKTYGVEDLKIDFDDALWNLIIELGDDDIHNAIISNDIELFFSLCKQKKLMSELDKSDLAKYLNRSGLEIAESKSVGLVAGPVVFVVAAAGCAVVGAAAAAVYETYWAWSEKIHEPIVRTSDIHAYQIWVLKAGHENTYIMLNEYQEKIVNDCIEVLNKHYSEQMEKVDVNALRQILAINVSIIK